jgi:hypothetical protein
MLARSMGAHSPLVISPLERHEAGRWRSKPLDQFQESEVAVA